MAIKDKATEQELSEIHGAMAGWCKLVLQGTPLLNDDGKAVLKEDGTPWLIPPTPAHLNVIRQFLKDNKIDNPLLKIPSDNSKDIVSGLPDFTQETTHTVN